LIELAIATRTPVAAWRDEDDVTIATALDILRIQAEAVRNGK
jgi:hypothetical protein